MKRMKTAKRSLQGKKLQFKFKKNSSEAVRQRITQALSEHGAERVRPLFPDVDNEKLASIFILDYTGQAKGRRLKEILASSKHIEFVEGGIERKLISRGGLGKHTRPRDFRD